MHLQFTFEKELGVKLFIRKGKHISVSEEGNKMFLYYTELLNKFDQLMAEAEKIKNEGKNYDKAVRITGIPAMSRYGVIISLMQFFQEADGIKLQIEECEEDKIWYFLKAGSCDIAFCSDIKLNPKDFSWQAYHKENFVAVVSVKSSLAGRERLSVSDLEDQKLILNLRESNLYDICIDACLSAGFAPEVALVTSVPPTANEYLIGRDGHVYLALSTLAQHHTGPLTRTIPIDGLPTFNYVMAWKKAARQPEHIRHYLDFLKQMTPEYFIQAAFDRRLKAKQ